MRRSSGARLLRLDASGLVHGGHLQKEAPADRSFPELVQSAAQKLAANRGSIRQRA